MHVKKLFEKQRKIFLAGSFGLLLLLLFLFGGKPQIGLYALHTISQEKGGIVKDSLPAKTLVTKVIDGDTIIVQGGSSVRLLGIDADEKNHPCYEPAQRTMEDLVLNKEAFLQKDQEDRDVYKRFLRYVFVGEQNINLEMVKRGLAVARFYPENQKYKQEIVAAEKTAMENHVGCKWGKK